jgi:hypothetical protein
MEKEFAPYEQAFALKELGFDEPCFGYYLCRNSTFGIDNLFITTEWIDLLPYDSSSCSAPLYQQAFRFFREKYNFDIGIAKDSHDIYHFQIDTNNYGNWILPIFSRKYEEAELECLKKLIEIVKNK